MKRTPGQQALDLIALTGGRRQVVGVFVCYLDDSEHVGALVSTMGGYVAHLDQWAKFESEAEELFRRYGVSVLHSKDFHPRSGEFKGWSEPKQCTFISELFNIAKECDLLGVAGSFRKSIFKKSKQKYGADLASNSLIGLCFGLVCGNLLSHESVKLDLSDGLSFIVERGKYMGEITNEFSKIAKRYSELKSLQFSKKEESRAIQIADFNAFYSRRAMSALAALGERAWVPAPAPFGIARELVHHLDFRVLQGAIEPLVKWKQIDAGAPLPRRGSVGGT